MLLTKAATKRLPVYTSFVGGRTCINRYAILFKVAISAKWERVLEFCQVFSYAPLSFLISPCFVWYRPCRSNKPEITIGKKISYSRSRLFHQVCNNKSCARYINWSRKEICNGGNRPSVWGSWSGIMFYFLYVGKDVRGFRNWVFSCDYGASTDQWFGWVS